MLSKYMQKKRKTIMRNRRIAQDAFLLKWEMLMSRGELFAAAK